MWLSDEIFVCPVTPPLPPSLLPISWRWTRWIWVARRPSSPSTAPPPTTASASTSAPAGTAATTWQMCERFHVRGRPVVCHAHFSQSERFHTRVIMPLFHWVEELTCGVSLIFFVREPHACVCVKPFNVWKMTCGLSFNLLDFWFVSFYSSPPPPPPLLLFFFFLLGVGGGGGGGLVVCLFVLSFLWVT